MGSLGFNELILIGVLLLILLGKEDTAPEIARKAGNAYQKIKKMFEELTSAGDIDIDDPNSSDGNSNSSS